MPKQTQPFSQWLRETRRQKGYTQEEIRRKLKVGRMLFYLVEKGERQLDPIEEHGWRPTISRLPPKQRPKEKNTEMRNAPRP